MEQFAFRMHSERFPRSEQLCRSEKDVNSTFCRPKMYTCTSHFDENPRSSSEALNIFRSRNKSVRAYFATIRLNISIECCSFCFNPQNDSDVVIVNEQIDD